MAGVEFVNRAPNQVNGFFADSSGGVPNQSIADSFLNDATWTIEYMSFWGGYFPFISPLADSFTIEFYADAGGLPGGAPVHTTGLSNLVRTDTGIDIFDTDEYKYDADLSIPASLGAGTFWVSITNDTGLGPNNTWFWETADGSGGAFSADAGGTWNPLGSHLSLVLGGSIPAPGALALLGVAGLAAGRRRRA